MERTEDALTELAAHVLGRARQAKLTIATAESCTGGLVGHLLTEVPGASATFSGGIVAYADDVKIAGLGVPSSTVSSHGAVSAQVAVAMAEGARRVLGVDLGVAVTGIAGPDGGSADKPVGLTYVAVADAAGHDVRRFQWTGDRHANKLASAGAALDLVLTRLPSAKP